MTVPARGVLVARGHRIAVRVQGGHLLVEHGFGSGRESRRLHRTAKLGRLVLIGQSGFISLDALRWLRDTGVALVHVDASGELIATSTVPGPDFAALRRAQALAADGPAGVELARHVLGLKLDGQRAMLRELPDGIGIDAAGALDRQLDDLRGARDIVELLGIEADAAITYWGAWSELAVPLPRPELAGVPEHWRTFGQRASLLTGGPRVATNPPNAILNYLYALLEGEAVLACHAVGLDAGVGAWHSDRRDRCSMALDTSRQKGASMPEPNTPPVSADMGTEPEAEVSIEWIRDFAQRWLEAWNSHQPDRLLELMTQDIEYHDDAWPKTMRGHADVREFLESTWRGIPDMTFELVAGPYVIPGEPRAAFHWRLGHAHRCARSAWIRSYRTPLGSRGR